MPRYQLIVEYDGSPFVGWQRQAEGASIQGALEAAVTAFSGETALVSGAGRTDAGVHACGQSAHLDLVRDWPADTVRDALNAHLNPLPIAVVSVRWVDDGFDARFSARARRYRYAILNRRAPPALDAGQVWHVARPLDVDTMHAAAQALTGTHDFTTFRAAQCQAKGPVKSLDRLDVARDGERVVVAASARSFLHTQVRSLVGSLKLVGEGRWTRGDLVVALEARDRRACGPVAPAQGLCLVRVDY